MKWETESKQRECYIKQKVHIGNRRKKSTHRKQEENRKYKIESKQRGRGTKLKVKQSEKTAVENRG